MRPRAALAHQRGLTLIELLLTVLIFSLVIGIFSQALFQVSLFSRTALRLGTAWQQQWMTGFALDDYFSSMAFQDAPGSTKIVGSATEFALWWIEPSGAAAGQPVPVVLTLRALQQPGAASGGSKWVLYVRDASGSESVRARWNQPVSFRYLDSSGAWQTTWPRGAGRVDDVRLETLPRSVQVVDAQGAIAHAWFFGGLTQPGLAPRREAWMPGSIPAVP